MKIFTSHSLLFHDSNFCFYDEKNLHYLKLERFVERKHFSSPMLSTTKENQEKSFLITKAIVKKTYGFDLRQIDDYHINHHLRHALSMELFSINDYDVHVVIDGIGDYDVWSIIRKHKIVRTQNVYAAKGSIGYIMSFLGSKL